MRVWSALMLVVLAAPSGSQEVEGQLQGRLFTTPAERRMLDRLRETAHQQATTPEPVPVIREPAPPPAEPLRLDGLVVRSGGPATVWVDGEPVTLKGETDQDIRIERGASASGGVTLRVPDQSRTVRLKPGQRYDPNTGSVTETFRSAEDPDRPVTNGP